MRDRRSFFWGFPLQPHCREHIHQIWAGIQADAWAPRHLNSLCWNLQEEPLAGNFQVLPGHTFLMSWATVFPPRNGFKVSKWKVAGGRWSNKKSPLRRETTPDSNGSKDVRTPPGVGTDNTPISSPRPTQVSIKSWKVAVTGVSFRVLTR